MLKLFHYKKDRKFALGWSHGSCALHHNLAVGMAENGNFWRAKVAALFLRRNSSRTHAFVSTDGSKPASESSSKEMPIRALPRVNCML